MTDLSMGCFVLMREGKNNTSLSCFLKQKNGDLKDTFSSRELICILCLYQNYSNPRVRKVQSNERVTLQHLRRDRLLVFP